MQIMLLEGQVHYNADASNHIPPLGFSRLGFLPRGKKKRGPSDGLFVGVTKQREPAQNVNIPTPVCLKVSKPGLRVHKSFKRLRRERA